MGEIVTGREGERLNPFDVSFFFEVFTDFESSFLAFFSFCWFIF